MKKLITGVVVFLAGALVVYSQGTLSFGNYYSGGSYVYVSLGTTRIGGSSTVTTGNPSDDTKNGNDWTVALYGNAAGIYPLVPLYTPAGQPVMATLAGGGSGNYLGEWFSTLIADVPNTVFQGQLATVQVLGWYNDGGVITSYLAAVAGSSPYGFSATGTVILGGPNLAGGPPSLPAELPYLGNISLTANQLVSLPHSVPEPSAIVLGMIGASAILARLRVKRN